MKKLLVIIVLGLLWSWNVNAGLLSFKTYAKCKAITSGEISWEIFHFVNKKNFKFFAFDQEFFYFNYNIAEKTFEKIQHKSGKKVKKEAIRTFYSKKWIDIEFDGTDGMLTFSHDGEYKYQLSCEKIRKIDLPKSKF
jgi:hypothetical protein